MHFKAGSRTVTMHYPLKHSTSIGDYFQQNTNIKPTKISLKNDILNCIHYVITSSTFYTISSNSFALQSYQTKNKRDHNVDQYKNLNKLKRNGGVKLKW